MKNVLKYYYDIDVNHIVYVDGVYKFSFKNFSYILSKVERSDEELIELYDVCNQLYLLNIPVHEFVLNFNNNIVTVYDGKRYVLLKKNTVSNEIVTFHDVINFSYVTKRKWKYKYISRIQWDKLWSEKIDYFEYQISQFGQKFPVASHSFDYYAGIVENSIQLFDFQLGKEDTYSICHKRFQNSMTIDDFYNPLNFIMDYSVRDVAEYLKSRMIMDIDVFDELKYCLDFNSYSNYEKMLFFIRMLFPSKQLDVYEMIFLQKKDEKIIYSLINSTLSYENNIKKIYALFSAYISIPKIEWLH